MDLNLEELVVFIDTYVDDAQDKLLDLFDLLLVREFNIVEITSKNINLPNKNNECKLVSLIYDSFLKEHKVDPQVSKIISDSTSFFSKTHENTLISPLQYLLIYSLVLNQKTIQILMDKYELSPNVLDSKGLSSFRYLLKPYYIISDMLTKQYTSDDRSIQYEYFTTKKIISNHYNSIIELLTSDQANLHYLTHQQLQTLLVIATTGSNIEIIKRLININPFIVEFRNEHCESILFSCPLEVEVHRCLLEIISEKNPNIFQVHGLKINGGLTSLHNLILVHKHMIFQSKKTVHTFLKILELYQRYCPNLFESKNVNNETPYYMFLRYSIDLEVKEKDLDKEFLNINKIFLNATKDIHSISHAQNYNVLTYLYHLKLLHNRDILQIMSTNKAFINLFVSTYGDDTYFVPLLYTIQEKDTKIFESIIKYIGPHAQNQIKNKLMFTRFYNQTKRLFITIKKQEDMSTNELIYCGYWFNRIEKYHKERFQDRFLKRRLSRINILGPQTPTSTDPLLRKYIPTAEFMLKILLLRLLDNHKDVGSIGFPSLYDLKHDDHHSLHAINAKHEIEWIQQKERLIVSHNIDRQILGHINNPKMNYVIIPIGILDEPAGHANMLIIDKRNKLIEHFEPYGGIAYFISHRFRNMETQLQEHFQKILPTYKYIFTIDFMPYEGFQYVENISDHRVQSLTDPGGYCLTWSFWYADVRIQEGRTGESIQQIRQKTHDSLQKIYYQHESGRVFIRNYVDDILTSLETFVKKIDISYMQLCTISDCTSRQWKAINEYFNKWYEKIITRL
jgi:hypothetical protein